MASDSFFHPKNSLLNLFIDSCSGVAMDRQPVRQCRRHRPGTRISPTGPQVSSQSKCPAQVSTVSHNSIILLRMPLNKISTTPLLNRLSLFFVYLFFDARSSGSSLSSLSQHAHLNTAVEKIEERHRYAKFSFAFQLPECMSQTRPGILFYALGFERPREDPAIAWPSE